MASAVILDRRDLFDWAVGQYRHGMAQVTADGYLPRELVRETRALVLPQLQHRPAADGVRVRPGHGLDLCEENGGAMRRPGPHPGGVGLHDPEAIPKTGGRRPAGEQPVRLAGALPVLYPCRRAWTRGGAPLWPLSSYRRR